MRQKCSSNRAAAWSAFSFFTFLLYFFFSLFFSDGSDSTERLQPSRSRQFDQQCDAD